MSEPFRITTDDLGRYVRRKSTGEVGLISRDPGNGWLYPRALQIYEWEHYAEDLEYVLVAPDRRAAAADQLDAALAVKDPAEAVERARRLVKEWRDGP